VITHVIIAFTLYSFIHVVRTSVVNHRLLTLRCKSFYLFLLYILFTIHLVLPFRILGE
jgi:hypothetical protein